MGRVRDIRAAGGHRGPKVEGTRRRPSPSSPGITLSSSVSRAGLCVPFISGTEKVLLPLPSLVIQQGWGNPTNLYFLKASPFVLMCNPVWEPLACEV